MDRESLEKIAWMFSSFSDATRLAIIMELKQGPLTVGELVERTEVSQGNVSKQLKFLHDRGMLVREKSGTQVSYSIGDEIVFTLCQAVCDKLNREAQSSATFVYQI